MTSSTALTGRTAKFQISNTTVARATEWSGSRKMATKSEWGDSDGNGWTNRAAGRQDFTFTSSGKYDTSSEQFDLFMAGDILQVGLWMDNSALYWAVPRALCDNFDLSVNIDTEEVLGWSAAWGADGQVYFPGEAGAPSYTLS